MVTGREDSLNVTLSMYAGLEPLSDEGKKKLGAWYRIREWYYTKVHRYAKQQFTKREVAIHLSLMLAWASPLLLNQYITLERKGEFALGLFGLYIVINAFKGWREFKPLIWLKARDDHAERNIGFARIVKQIADGSMVRDTHAFQRDTLYLIANYVRSWRRDSEAKKIFANLIIEEFDGLLTVIARDREELFGARQVPKTYSKDDRLVSKCFENGARCTVGDLRVEFKKKPDEAYRSILAIPLKDRDSNVIGVLSIDSSEPFHFSLDSKELEINLQPYIAALECSLLASRGNRR